MNLKILKYTVLIVLILLWLPGFSPHIARWLYEQGITKDEYRFGDLYRFSNLPEYKVPNQVCPENRVPVTSPNTSVYIIGDSFTDEPKVAASDLAAGSYHWFRMGDATYAELDKTKKNVLILETVERHFRERFSYVNKQLIVDSLNQLQEAKKMIKNAKANFWYDPQRHEAVLFSSDFFLTIREWKAGFNERVFGRTNKNVVLSKDKKNIFYEPDARPNGINSSFDKISDEEIALLVANVNLTYDFYKKKGFDEVYLSIAPNKSSILGTDLGTYNHLIERIQQNPDLRMPFFDVYTPFRQSKKMLYDIGDTHWNCEGKQIWLNAVNEKL